MASASAERPRSTFALIRLNAFSFGVTGFILAMDAVVLPVIVLTLAPEHLKNSYLAALGITGLIIAALTQPVIGGFSDRFRSPLGRRVPFILWGVLIVCASLVGLRLAPNFVVLLAVWTFIQANINTVYGPGQALIRDLVPIHRIGVASSLKILLDAAGGMSLIVLSGMLIALDSEGGRVDWTWVTLGGLGAVLLVTAGTTCFTVLAWEGPVTRRNRASREASYRESLASIWRPQIGLFVVSRLLMMTAIACFYIYGLFFLRDVVEVDDPARSMARMGLSIGIALGVMVYISGWVSDHVGRKPVVVVGATGAALSTLWMLTANSSAEVMMIATVIGASVGALVSANWAMANELVGQEQAGFQIGIINLSTIGGAAIARVLGPLIDLLNHISEDLGYRALITGCAGLFIVGAAMLIPVKSARPMPQTPSG